MWGVQRSVGGGEGSVRGGMVKCVGMWGVWERVGRDVEKCAVV